jgi:hypothetical protein
MCTSKWIVCRGLYRYLFTILTDSTLVKRRVPVYIAITKTDNKEVLQLTVERATDELERLL